MQKASARETVTTETGIELAALSAVTSINSRESSTPSHGDDTKPIQTSSVSSNSGDIEEGTTTPKDKTVSENLRTAVRDIKSNKIARRTLHAMGAVAASQGLEVQIQSEVDSRQSLAYGFLSDCANRMSQNQPLGPDCEKYVTMTPKAPPDIDKWVIDPGASNNSSGALKKRDNRLSVRDVHNPPPFANLRVDNLSVSYIVLIAFADVRFWVIAVVLLGVIVCWDKLSMWMRLRMKFNIELRIDRKLVWFLRRTRLLFPILPVLCICKQVYHEMSSWSATLAFLEACRNQEKLGLPQGDDCLKYRGKELKPRITLPLSQLVAQASLLIFLGFALRRLWQAYISRRANQQTLGEYVRASRLGFRGSSDSLGVEPSREGSGEFVRDQTTDTRYDWRFDNFPFMTRDLDQLGDSVSRRGSVSSGISGRSSGIDLDVALDISGMRARIENMIDSVQEVLDLPEEAPDSSEDARDSSLEPLL